MRKSNFQIGFLKGIGDLGYKMARKKKISKRLSDFEWYSAIIGILSYFAIIIMSLFELDISIWVTSFLFLLIGVYLLANGSVHLFFKYLKNGLTRVEVTRIVSIVVGIISIVVGIVMSPLFGVQTDVVEGLKIIISIIAIVTIIAERLAEK